MRPLKKFSIPKEKEAAYSSFMMDYNIGITQWLSILGAVLSILFIILDFWRTTDILVVLILRGITAVTLILTANYLFKNKPTAFALLAIQLGVAIIFFTASFFQDKLALMPSYFLPNSLILGLLVCNALTGLKFRYQIALTIGVAGAYVAYSLTITPHPSHHISQMFNLLTYGLMISLIGFLIERFKRQNFLNREELLELQKYLKDGESIARLGSWDWNLLTNRVVWTDGMYKIFGVEPKSFSGDVFQIIEQTVHPDDAQKVRASAEASIAAGKVIPYKYRLCMPGGEIKHVYTQGNMYHDNGGEIIGMRGTVQDITEQELANQSLASTKEMLERVILSGREAIWEMNFITKEAYFSDAWKEMFGYDNDEIEIMRTNWMHFIHPDDAPMVSEVYKEAREEKKNQVEIEFRVLHKLGHYIWTKLHARISYDKLGVPFKITGANSDISERKYAELNTLKALSDKELLIKEIHHRVKNNLQLISSILYIRMDGMKKSLGKDYLEDTRQKIRSISLIHERLLQSGSVNEVDISDYLGKLITDLRISNSHQELPLQFETQIQSEQMSLDMAINCGLIVNEMVTNSIKHAFVGRSDGKIEISLNKNEGIYRLMVRDNGKTIPESVKIGQSGSFGMQMLDIFIRQLGGTVEVSRENGTCFTIIFQGLNRNQPIDELPVEQVL